jgi:hypothetical protein
MRCQQAPVPMSFNMWSMRKKSREFWVYSTLFGSLAFLAVGVAYFYWYWPSEQGHLARRNARKQGITVLPLVGTPFSTGQARIRPAAPLGTILVLEVAGHDFGNPDSYNYFFVIDTATNAIRPASKSEWDEAAGVIGDDLQVTQVTGERPFNIALEKVIPKWSRTDATGRHVMECLHSPTEDYIALLSADGRFHPPVRGLLWGREAYADGQHYLEVRSMKDGAMVGLPVAIPLPTKTYVHSWWTADERFVVFRYREGQTNYIIIVPTGIELEPIQ